MNCPNERRMSACADASTNASMNAWVSVRLIVRVNAR
jgi:hypothetical protein